MSRSLAVLGLLALGGAAAMLFLVDVIGVNFGAGFLWLASLTATTGSIICLPEVADRRGFMLARLTFAASGCCYVASFVATHAAVIVGAVGLQTLSGLLLLHHLMPRRLRSNSYPL